MKKITRQERDGLTESITAGNADKVEGAAGRLKTQFDDSASQMGGLEASETRAMSHFLGKMQALLHDYTVAANRLKQTKILSWNLETQAMLDTNQQIGRDFLASNEALADAEEHSADLWRAEYDAEKIPAHIRDSMLQAHAQRAAALNPLQMEVRRSDRAEGENALATRLARSELGQMDPQRHNGSTGF